MEKKREGGKWPNLRNIINGRNLKIPRAGPFYSLFKKKVLKSTARGRVMGISNPFTAMVT